MIQASDLDPNRHPNQSQFSYDSKTYRITWEKPSQVNLFLVLGGGLQPLGAYDCTNCSANDGSMVSIVCQVVTADSDSRFTYQPSELKAQIQKALSIAQSLNQSDHRSRELNLVITKLEEGLMWLEKAIALSGGSGLE